MTAAASGADRRLLEILACPSCQTRLEPGTAAAGKCEACGNPYRRLPHAWELLPPRSEVASDIWATWEQLQANGVVSYEADPHNNLAFGPREDASAFANFADLRGSVLDIGCGPQPIPAYFSPHEDGTGFTGIDPLVGDLPAEYPKVRGLAEYLPFVAGAFDRVLFATTLDHFVDPVRALKEAGRVLVADGQIVVWLGHKREGAPAPAVSHAWYDELETPRGADDVFHIKRLGPEQAVELFESAALEVREAEHRQVDDYRSNHFFRLAGRRG